VWAIAGMGKTEARPIRTVRASDEPSNKFISGERKGPFITTATKKSLMEIVKDSLNEGQVKGKKDNKREALFKIK